ncbi:MAG: Hsp33 family molecular chaperone HslO [Xanthomonadaceae bacterium]|nr:Hsp33 family molecular chaperone HslO [Xanthomonadaceae bacterium]
MSQPTAHPRDTQLRFLLPAAGVRGVAVQLASSWQTIAGRSHYPDAAATLLGEACAAAALFTGHAKVDGRLSVQLRSNGPISTLFAECTAAGTLRGIVRLREDAAAPAADLRALGADAVLAITIENPALGNAEPMRYQGLVALQSERLDQAFEDYFRQSEQLPTRLLLACNGQRAVGLLLQKLPGAEGDEDGFRRTSALFDTLGRDELLALPATEVIHRLFHEESPQLLGEKPLDFACSCSRERVEAMLVSLGREEADAAVHAGNGHASVVCEFCGQGYQFDAAHISRLFTLAGSAHSPAASVQ